MLELHLLCNCIVIIIINYIVITWSGILAMDYGYFLLFFRSIESLVRLLRLFIAKFMVHLVHLLLLSSLLKNPSEKLVIYIGVSYGRKTGKRYMKQYREKFVQYFPTLVAEIIQLHGWDRDHMKEVCMACSYEIPVVISTTFMINCAALCHCRWSSTTSWEVRSLQIAKPDCTCDSFQVPISGFLTVAISLWSMLSGK